MTLKELKNHVLSLGYETEFESEQIFKDALSRAIYTIFTERAHYKTAVVKQRERLPVFYQKNLFYKGTAEHLQVNAKAYSFTTDGIGQYTVKDLSGEKTFSFEGLGKLHRGFIIGGGEIIFGGDYSYTVFDIALYDEIFSDKVSDILPYGEKRVYEMDSLVNDFLAFSGRVFDSNGKAVEGAKLSERKIYLPFGFTGTAYITYKCSPQIDFSKTDAPLPVSEECAHLLPLLTAAYVWLDDDAQKAANYMTLYREGMASVKINNRPSVDPDYTDVIGW